MLTEKLRKELKKARLTMLDLKNILLDNFVQEKPFTDEKFLDLRYLDLSDFDGDVDISDMKVKRQLLQDRMTIGNKIAYKIEKIVLWQTDTKEDGKDNDIRLYHYKLIPYLPRGELYAQWHYLNLIFKNESNSSSISYVYEYPKFYLKIYSMLVLKEMRKRNYKVKGKSIENYKKYFNDIFVDPSLYTPTNATNIYPDYHDDNYLLQCYNILKDKYEKDKQRTFDTDTFCKLKNFVQKELKNKL